MCITFTVLLNLFRSAFYIGSVLFLSFNLLFNEFVMINLIIRLQL